MGMAASQARLLTITARMHDVEYKAQSIQNAKIQLSTQSDQVYQEYLEALDATTLTVDDINGNTITANFNNLVGKNGVETGNNYALRTSNGQLIVEDEVKDAYDEYDGNDPYEFAMMMIFGDAGNALDRDNLEQCENQAFENNCNIGSDDMNSMIAIKDKMDKILTDNGVEDYNDLTDEAKDEYDELEQSYKYKLYKNFGSEIFALAYADEGVEEDDFNQDEFNFYANLYKQIVLAGGCVSIADYNGTDGDAANNSEWLKNMIQCGKISIEIVNQDKKTGQVSFNTTSPDSDTYVSYTTTTTIDKSALAKAEAEYEHKTKQIDQKDKKFDMDLSKLETERTALTTEYESVKKVISDNIERTFGIFRNQRRKKYRYRGCGRSGGKYRRKRHTGRSGCG